MKYTKEDNLKLIYLGLEQRVVESVRHGRSGTLSPTTTEYILEDGTRIFPIHFVYDYAKIPGNKLTWLMKASYPASLLRGAMSASNDFLKKIPKDDTWKGASFVIPFKV